jgi:hypothetical protein
MRNKPSSSRRQFIGPHSNPPQLLTVVNPWKLTRPFGGITHQFQRDMETLERTELFRTQRKIEYLTQRPKKNQALP